MTVIDAERRNLASRRHVRRIVLRSGSSFVWPMRLQPKAKREAIFAVYAVARVLDDIADDDGMARDERLRRLDGWRREIERVYAGRARSRIGRALTPAVGRFALDKTAFLELIDGMETDARGPVVAPDAEELRLYCRRVAGTVGRLCVAIFGRTDPTARALAVELGEALQLTNILRDIEEDAGRGRLYLPRELLEKVGIAARGRPPAAILRRPELPEACEDLARLAEAAFARAATLAAEGGWTSLGPALRMMAVYRLRLEGLKARGFRRLDAVRLRRRDRLRALLLPRLIV